VPLKHKKGISRELPCILTDDIDFKTRKTGITFDQVTVKYAKEGETSLTTKSMTAEDWIELGGGLYNIVFTMVELSDGGKFIYDSQCSGCIPYSGLVQLTEYELDEHAREATLNTHETAQAGHRDFFESSGSEAVTIYAKEETTENPIPESYFEIWDASNSVRLYRDEDSDADGTAIFNLAPGEYKVRIRKPFWDFPTYSDLTVPAGGTSLTVHATFFSPSAPPGPDLCVVYGWVIDTQNNKIEGATIKATLDNDEVFDEGSQKVSDMIVETTSNTEGYFELALISNLKYSIPGTRYEFEITKADQGYRWRKMGVVPDLDNAKLEDIVSPAT